MKRTAVIVGLGGIGSWLYAALGRFLQHSAKPEDWKLVLIDGDEYEPRNTSRQLFTRIGNKADIQAAQGRVEWPQLMISSIPQYLGEGQEGYPVQDAILEGDFVFLCVDNHKTRKYVADHCETLVDVTLISGGNDLTDGNVQVYLRRSKKNLTPRIWDFHPEIATPKDKSPHEMSCEERAATGTPQVIFANMQAASLMAQAFFQLMQGRMPAQEVFFDINTSACRPDKRRKNTDQLEVVS